MGRGAAMMLGKGVFTTLADNSNMNEQAGHSFSAGTFTGGASSNVASRTATALVGDFIISLTWGASDTPSNVGIFDAAELATFSATAADGLGNLDAMTNSFYWVVIAGTDGIYKGASSVATPGDYAVTDTVVIRRVGSIITMEKNGAVQHTYAAGSSADMHFCMMNDNGRTIANATNVGWTQ